MNIDDSKNISSAGESFSYAFVYDLYIEFVKLRLVKSKQFSKGPLVLTEKGEMLQKKLERLKNILEET